MNKPLLYLLTFLLPLYVTSQDATIGLIEINQDKVFEGYTLFSTLKSSDIYLIDNCGEVINQWQLEDGRYLKTAYLDKEGNLYVSNGSDIYKFDWDGDLIWEYDNPTPRVFFHHDFEVMPNGNLLVMADETFFMEEAYEWGFDTTNVVQIRIAGLYEYEIDGTNFNLIWRWNFKDHLVQEKYPDLDNYNLVSETPRKLNVHYKDPIQSADWLHVNGLDYNEDLDQIIISSFTANEVFIIDHSTTIDEAASGSGGNSGLGGDFLWRWGNGVFQNQHDPNWIPADHEFGGMISVFNNVESFEPNPYSAIKILAPVPDPSGGYTLDSGNSFLPVTVEHTISGEEHGISNFIVSGAHSLPNGNFIVCSGERSQFFELTSESEVVWKYINPVFEIPVPQYNMPLNTLTFNIQKYGLDFPGFEGRDMTPKGIIEDINLNSEACRNSSDVDEQAIFDLNIYPNPLHDTKLYFDSDKKINLIEVYGMDGKLVDRISNPNNWIELPDQRTNYLLKFFAPDGYVLKTVF